MSILFSGAGRDNSGQRQLVMREYLGREINGLKARSNLQPEEMDLAEEGLYLGMDLETVSGFNHII